MMKKLKYTENYLQAQLFSFGETYNSIGKPRHTINAFNWSSMKFIGKMFESAYHDNKTFKDYNLHLLGILTNKQSERDLVFLNRVGL